MTDELILTKPEPTLLQWAKTAIPGPRYIYHHGPCLMRERVKDAALNRLASEAWYLLASEAWYLYESGRAILVQSRCADETFDYILIAGQFKIPPKRLP